MKVKKDTTKNTYSIKCNALEAEIIKTSIKDFVEVNPKIHDDEDERMIVAREMKKELGRKVISFDNFIETQTFYSAKEFNRVYNPSIQVGHGFMVEYVGNYFVEFDGVKFIVSLDKKLYSNFSLMEIEKVMYEHYINS